LPQRAVKKKKQISQEERGVTNRSSYIQVGGKSRGGQRSPEKEGWHCEMNLFSRIGIIGVPLFEGSPSKDANATFKKKNEGRNHGPASARAGNGGMNDLIPMETVSEIAGKAGLGVILIGKGKAPPKKPKKKKKKTRGDGESSLKNFGCSEETSYVVEKATWKGVRSYSGVRAEATNGGKPEGELDWRDLLGTIPKKATGVSWKKGFLLECLTCRTGGT